MSEEEKSELEIPFQVQPRETPAEKPVEGVREQQVYTPFGPGAEVSTGTQWKPPTADHQQRVMEAVERANKSKRRRR